VDILWIKYNSRLMVQKDVLLLLLLLLFKQCFTVVALCTTRFTESYLILIYLKSSFCDQTLNPVNMVKICKQMFYGEIQGYSIFAVITLVSASDVTHGRRSEVEIQPKFGSIFDKPSNWVNILNEIFNPKFGFVHFLPKIGLKQPSIF